MKVPKKQQNIALDKLTYVAGMLLPLSTVPQAYAIWVSKEVAGVSLITWGFYLISSSLFAVFGIVHKQKLLIMTYVPFVAIELIIVSGLLVIK